MLFRILGIIKPDTAYFDCNHIYFDSLLYLLFDVCFHIVMLMIYNYIVSIYNHK